MDDACAGRAGDPAGTPADIRAALPPERRAEFDVVLAVLDAVGPAGKLCTLRPAWWELETVHGAVEETGAEIARLRSGDHSGAVTLDENGDLVPLDGHEVT
ncbi:hypothetical protein ACIP88_35070 [Streptomyces uncialis]|uniref:hypothetical protein n=1 Tax=Streptomyces uncialis TaxID=1048205 RepID=UPI0037F30DDF